MKSILNTNITALRADFKLQQSLRQGVKSKYVSVTWPSVADASMQM